MHKRTPPHLLFRYQSCGHSLNLNDPHDLYELSIDFCYFAISHNTPLLTNWSSLHHLVTFRFFDLYFRLYIYICYASLHVLPLRVGFNLCYYTLFEQKCVRWRLETDVCCNFFFLLLSLFFIFVCVILPCVEFSL